MEFFDWNGQRLDVVTGRYFRPPILNSNGPSLVIRFYANGGSALGFKATYSFIFDQDDDNQTEYITDCGGYVENVGGGITMMNMVKNGEKKFDCFWIIKPIKSYLHFKTHLYLKIANFSDMEGNTKLIVHQGSTSAEKDIMQLTCDGFDHCGDNSDEPATCYGDSDPQPMDRRWYSHTPNYFFPKIDPYSDLKTVTMVFIVCSLGLIGLVSAMFVLLYRFNTRTRHEQELQNHLQIITDLLEEETLDSDSISDEPPVYEAPPDYDEIIKANSVTVNVSMNCGKPKRPKRRKKKSKISKSHCSMKDTSENQKDLEDSLTLQTDEKINTKKRFKKNNQMMYLSDKAISTNVRDMLKRKWYSQSELMNIKKDSEASDRKKQNKTKTIFMFSPLRSYENSIDLSLFKRETASDSELLHLTLDDEQEYVNGVMGSCGKEYYMPM
ncbi:CUB and LDLa domain [Carabus blaptoides fortunei]